MVPPAGREAVLSELHEGHHGITRLSRMYVWWPSISSDIEKSVRRCHQCQETQSTPPVTPLNRWKWPTRPWARLHLDFAGPFEGKTILVIIDAHSKWIEATCTPSTASSHVIEVLRTPFASFGLPQMVVTDNGTGFVSREFEHFLATSAPYHPASNGLAERAVQIVKGLKKETSGTMASQLARVLCSYRITPQTTTGVSPAQLLLGRRPRTRLDLLKTNLAERDEQKQLDQKARHDQRAKARSFRVGDTMFVQNFGFGDQWLPGVILSLSGPVSYIVELAGGRQKRCHQDHLRARMPENGGIRLSLGETPQEECFPVGPSEVNGPAYGTRLFYRSECTSSTSIRTVLQYCVRTQVLLELTYRVYFYLTVVSHPCDACILHHIM